MNRDPGPRPALRRAAGAAVLALALLPVAGCGGGGSSELKDTSPTTTTQAPAPAAAGVVLAVTGTEYSYGPPALKAAPGKTTIRFTNKGSIDHDFSIDALKINLTAKPGKTAETTVTLKPGTYKTHCAIPGHTESGMHGTLTVS